MGKPGILDDLTILYTSALVADLLQRRVLPNYQFKIDEKNHSQLYVLVDVIYPHCSNRFVDHQRTDDKKGKTIFRCSGIPEKGYRKSFRCPRFSMGAARQALHALETEEGRKYFESGNNFT